VPEDFKAQKNESNSVELSFEVNKNGEPVNIKIEKSLCSSCDKEAIRLINKAPAGSGMPGKTQTTVTINF
jgi:TonB family protein